MSNVDAEYVSLIAGILFRGQEVVTRNSGVKRLAGARMEFDRAPLVSVRKTSWKNALREWQWFMSGSDNINDLHPAVREWWSPWADTSGRVAFNYSEQFRRQKAVSPDSGGTCEFDQIGALIDGVAKHPFSRRNVITTWNSVQMWHPSCPITNCHGTVIQVLGNNDGSIDLLTLQRSVDVVCGLPHNLIQYWAFLLWIAHRASLKPGRLIWVGGDVHVYDEHADLALEILNAPLPEESPAMIYSPSSKEFAADDFSLDRPYEPKITKRAKMVV